jgi:hypothetical protein
MFCKISLASEVKKSEESKGKNFDIKSSFTVFGGNNNTSFEATDQPKKFTGFEGFLSGKHTFDVGGGSETKYGVSFNAKLKSNNTSNPIYLNELSFFVSNEEEGTRLFGLQPSIASKMRIDSTILSPFADGVNGVWQNLIIFPEKTFITKQGMWMETGFASNYFLQGAETGDGLQPLESWGSSNFAFSYVSSRQNGWRFGVSYMPDNKTNFLLQKTDLTDLKGLKPINFDDKIYLRNIISTGINFYDAFGDFELAFFTGFERATSVSDVKKRDLNSYSLGLNLSYLGVSFGGSLTNFGRSLYVKDAQIPGNNTFFDENGVLLDAGKSYVFDVGLGYAIHKYSTSISFLQSKYANNRFSAGVFSFETKVTTNLANYFQVAKYQFKDADLNISKDVQKTKGWIFVIGVKYSF